MNRLIFKFAPIALFILLDTSVMDVSGKESKPEKKEDAIVIRIPDMTSIRNPFLPQLPQKEKVEKKVPKTTKPVVRPKTSKPKTRAAAKPREIKIKAAEMPKVNITGLVWNSDRPQAIVNGDIVNVGDQVGDAKITDIRKNEIDFSFQGETLTIKSQKEIVYE